MSKYLVIIDSQLTFKKQVKKVGNKIKVNLVNFSYMNNLTTLASKLYINTTEAYTLMP